MSATYRTLGEASRQTLIASQYLALLLFFCTARSVYARGCFTPSTQVLLADGTTRAIGNVSEGEEVVTWDEREARATTATIMAVSRFRHRGTLLEIRLEDGMHITATPDHPFWSFGQNRLVSAEPQATQESYNLETALIMANETFHGPQGQPVRGAVSFANHVHGLKPASANSLLRSLAGNGGDQEVVTLCLNRHHWFFVQGIRVHNKGGCFIPSTPVTLVTAEGNRQAPLSSIQRGDVVLSWDANQGVATSATVQAVQHHFTDVLMEVSIPGPGLSIISTPDHPFWSHSQQHIVSRDHVLTARDYGLAVLPMGENETLASESGQPVLASVRPLSAHGMQRALRSSATRGVHSGLSEVLTLCLDSHHWFFVHGVRVHNKGCFVPSTLVTLANGARKQIGEVAEGDLVRSWDETTQKASNATVLAVKKILSDGNLMEMSVHSREHARRLVSTLDHPYWSYAQGTMVSRQPLATKQEYGLPVGMLRDVEVFADDLGRPLEGRVEINGTFWHRRLGNAGTVLPEQQTVITLCLDQHHWFFAEGVRVHNKGGCFVPSTPVTLADGSKTAIANVLEGMVVRSWDADKQVASNATVAAVRWHKSNDLMHVHLAGGSGAQITSTPDHPYWSHARGRVVSKYPHETSRTYGLDVAMMGSSEIFADERGRSVSGTVHYDTAGNMTAAAVARQLRSAPVEVGTDVLTLCLDKHHWFFVHGIRVHNKGCFAPATPVTLSDGSQAAIGGIRPGDVVLSWDAVAQHTRNATVQDVVRTTSREFMDVQLEVGGNVLQITSTLDHPYWSHRQQRLVSLDRLATQRDYHLAVGLAEHREEFSDAAGRPVRGFVRKRPLADAQHQSLLQREGNHSHCNSEGDCEMVTLTLEESHWFFVHGIRVHNKGGSKYCCCAIGYKWDGHQCVPCPGDGLANQGQECFEKCGQRSGPCPTFCGSGKCCRAQWHEPGAQVGPQGCGEYEGGDGKHVCMGSAQPGLVHPAALCWENCSHRSGRCDFCGHEGFCCRMHFTSEADLTGQDACLPGEGPPDEHRCVRREEVSCDVADPILESTSWAWCDKWPQEQCDYKDSSTYCCCDKAYQWNVGSQQCDLCDGYMEWVKGGELKGSAVDSCPGTAIIDSTINDGFCHASEHLHGCDKPGSNWIGNLIIAGACVFCCCWFLWPWARSKKHNAAARRCKSFCGQTRPTTCAEQAQRDSSYRDGWYCDSCNKFSPFSYEPFQRCDECEVDFCDECLDQDSDDESSQEETYSAGDPAPRQLRNYAASAHGVQPLRHGVIPIN